MREVCMSAKGKTPLVALTVFLLGAGLLGALKWTSASPPAGVRQAEGNRSGGVKSESAGRTKARTRKPRATRLPSVGPRATATLSSTTNPAETGDDASGEVEVARAKQALESLKLQEPERFLEIFDMMKKTSSLPEARFAAARDVTRVYLSARTNLLATALQTFIDSDGNESDESSLDAIEALEATYRAELKQFVDLGPTLDVLPDMIAKTSHPMPFFAYEDET